jgi:hypothetical protein
VTRQLPHYPQCVAASGCLALKQWGLAAVAIVGLLVVVPMSGGGTDVGALPPDPPLIRMHCTPCMRPSMKRSTRLVHWTWCFRSSLRLMDLNENLHLRSSAGPSPISGTSGRNRERRLSHSYEPRHFAY